MAAVDENRGTQLTLGVMGRSLKENEHRLPLHPRHFVRIHDELRDLIYLEHAWL